MPHLTKLVLPATDVFTTSCCPTAALAERGIPRTDRVNHSEGVYVSGDVHTNTIEGFWSLTKNGIRGVYHSVSARHLQGYLNEYAWRYSHRDG